MTKTDPPSPLLRSLVAMAYSQTSASSDAALPKKYSEWSIVITDARKHGLGPILYWILQQSNLDTPQDYHHNLHHEYLTAASHNLLAAQDLQQIGYCMEMADIKIILLKGAALFEQVYPDPALRPMLDLDILIPFSQLPEARLQLASLGYHQADQFPCNDQTGLFWNQVAFVNDKETRTPLELHWHLLDIPYYSQNMPLEAFLEGAIPLNDEQPNVFFLGPEDQILHLCAHNIYHHQGNYHRTAVDIGFLLSHYQDTLDWDKLILKARKYNLEHATYATLTTALQDWHVPIPVPVLSSMRGASNLVRERFFVASQNHEVMKVFRTLLTLPTWSMKAQFARGQLFPSREYLVWRYQFPEDIPLPLAYLKRARSGLKSLLFEINRQESPPNKMENKKKRGF